MMRQLWAIAVGLMVLAFSAEISHAQTDSTVNGWVTSYLPRGVTVQSATCPQIQEAVKAALRAHPKQAKAIVSFVFSRLTAADKCKALALIDAILSTVPQDEAAGLIQIAIGSLSSTVDPQTGQSAFSALGSLSMQQAIADDPGLAAAILAAIGSSSAGQGTQLLGGGPGNVTNPANFSNTTGAVNSPQ
jgi:hypothetical protein